MWLNSQIAKQLGVKIPLIQAPMAGGATTPELVSMVSNSGALGSLGAGYMEPLQIRDSIKKIRQLTNSPFAVNLFIPEEYNSNQQQIENMQQIIEHVCTELNLGDINTSLCALSFDEQINVLIEEKVPIFSFTFGIPDKKYIHALKKNNTVLIGTATNLQEVYLLEDSGIDIIVVQGLEAGGHRGTFKTHANDGLITLNELLTQVVNKIQTPIIAAGGIMNAEGIFTALNMGACGVQLGTAFLTCYESGIHPKYKEVLLNTKTDNTVLTRSFSGKLARGIENTFIKRMKKYEDKILDYPIQNMLTQPIRKVAAQNNNVEFLSMWAGQSAALCESVSAKALIDRFNQDMIELLSNARGQIR